MGSDARFLLFTTASISPDSFLNKFVENGAEDRARAEAAAEALEKSQATTITMIRSELGELTEQEAHDFYGRITIFPDTSRISEVPQLIDKRLRTVRRRVPASPVRGTRGLVDRSGYQAPDR